jgi:hypothetical protein
MAARQLPLLQLGDHTQYAAYQQKFIEIYQDQRFVDPLGHTLYLPPNSCEHFCLKPRSYEPGFRSIRESWQQLRAERIGWLAETFQDPDEIRPNHQYKKQDSNRPPEFRRRAYLTIVIPSLPAPQKPEYFYVSVKPERQADGSIRMVFLTAYPVPIQYWKDARKGGKPLYHRQ